MSTLELWEVSEMGQMILDPYTSHMCSTHHSTMHSVTCGNSQDLKNAMRGCYVDLTEFTKVRICDGEQGG